MYVQYLKKLQVRPHQSNMYFFKIKKRYPCGEGIYGKGQITVFMALTITIIFSVILTAVESARVNTVSLLAQTASELAVESALAEYNIPLYEMYGIFAIDGNREDFTKDILSYARKNEGKGFLNSKRNRLTWQKQKCSMRWIISCWKKKLSNI